MSSASATLDGAGLVFSNLGWCHEELHSGLWIEDDCMLISWVGVQQSRLVS